MIETTDFRNAMSLLSSAVSVVTTAGLAGRYGFTASAVCSVTDTPPTLLVCMNQSSSSHMHFVENKILTVNVLSAHISSFPMFFHLSLVQKNVLNMASGQNLKRVRLYSMMPWSVLIVRLSKSSKWAHIPFLFVRLWRFNRINITRVWCILIGAITMSDIV